MKVRQLRSLYSKIRELLSFDLLSQLPPELSEMIFSYLDVLSLCTVAQCCRSWRDMSNKDTLWYFCAHIASCSGACRITHSVCTYIHVGLNSAKERVLWSTPTWAHQLGLNTTDPPHLVTEFRHFSPSRVPSLPHPASGDRCTWRPTLWAGTGPWVCTAWLLCYEDIGRGSLAFLVKVSAITSNCFVYKYMYTSATPHANKYICCL